MRRFRVIGIVFLPLAPLLFVWMALQTQAGGAFAGNLVSLVANREIRGTLGIGSIYLGVDGLRIREIELLDPDGEKVLDAEGVLVRARTESLLRGLLGGGPLVVDEVRLVGARILLEQRASDGTLSLLRAVDSRRRALAGDEPGELIVEVGRLVGDRLAVAFLDEGMSPFVAVRELGFDSSASVDPRGAKVSGQLTAPAGLEPYARKLPLRLDFDVSLGGGFRTIEMGSFSLDAGESSLSLEGEGDLVEGTALLKVKALRLRPEELAAIVPSLRLAALVEGGGEARLQSGVVEASLRLEQQGGSVEASGSFNPRTLSWSASAKARSISLDTFDPSLPALVLSAEVEASGEGEDRIDGTLRAGKVETGGISLGPLAGSGSLQGGTLEVQRLDASLPGATLHAGGRIQLSTGQASLRFDLNARELGLLLDAGSRLAAVLGRGPLELPEIRGSLEASGSFEGALGAPTIDARIRTPLLTWGENSIHDVSLEASFAGFSDRATGRFHGTIGKIVTPSGTLQGLDADLSLSRERATGSVEVESPIGPIRGLLAAEVAQDLSRLRFERLALGWPGTTWSLREPAVVTLAPSLHIEPLFFDGDHGAVVAGSARIDEAGMVEAEVQASELHLARLLPGFDETSSQRVGSLGFELKLRDREVTLDARLAGVEASAIGSLAGLEAPVGGRIDGTVYAKGIWPALEAILAVDGTDLSAAGIDGVQLRLSAGWPGGLSVDAARGGELLKLRVESLPALAGLLTDPEGELRRTMDAPLIGEAELRGISIESVADRLGLSTSLQGDIDLELSSTGSIRQPQGRARLGLKALRDGELGPVEGSLEAAFGEEGIEATLTTSIQGRRFLGGAFRLASAAGGRMHAKVEIDDGRGGLADLEAAVAIGLEALLEPSSATGVSTLAEAGLDWSFSASGLHLDALQSFLPEVHRLEGIVDGELAGAGSLAAPTFEGFFTLREGRLGYTGLGELRDLGLDVEIDADRITLRKLEARSSGLLQASGQAIRQGRSSPYELSLDVTSRGFGLVSGDLIRAYLDSDARFEGRFFRGSLEGKLELISTIVDLPDTPSKKIQDLGQHPDFRIGGEGDDSAEDTGLVVSADAKGELEQDPLRASVAIVTRDPITLQGADVKVRAKTDLLLLYESGAVALRGEIETIGGVATALGRRFVLERGKLSYTGSEALSNPQLDVVALHESPHAKVTITVGGSGQSFLSELRSDPPMSEAEIATLLATGRPQAERGAGGMAEASGAASALGTVVTSQLKRNLAPKLPVDLIAYQAGEDGLSTGSLEAGSYVTDRVYVEYSRNFGIAEDDRRNTNQIRVEYQLSRRWTLEVTYGDRGAGAGSVFWTREFP